MYETQAGGAVPVVDGARFPVFGADLELPRIGSLWREATEEDPSWYVTD